MVGTKPVLDDKFSFFCQLNIHIDILHFMLLHFLLFFLFLFVLTLYVKGIFFYFCTIYVFINEEEEERKFSLYTNMLDSCDVTFTSETKTKLSVYVLSTVSWMR